MTRTDGKESPAEKDQEASMGHVLQVSVGQALEQGRLTCGVQACAQLLQIDPFNAMICVLPDSTETNATDGTDSSPQVSSQIYRMLIEAFCREYDIRLVKVDSLDKLAKMVNEYGKVDNGLPSKRSVSVTDVNCLLLQYPQHAPSQEDEQLAEYYKSTLFMDDPSHCVIALPD